MDYFNDDSDKKLFEDLQFKRKVAFVDDDAVINIGLKPFSKSAEKTDIQDEACQVNILNELVSSVAQTRARKHKEIQTENEVDKDIGSERYDENKVRRLFEKRAHLIEEAILENNESPAFLGYEVDWYGGSASITNPFTLVNQQLLKTEDLQAIAVEWNSSGTTICCGYGRYDHESVCTHKGALCTWNIDRLKIDVNKPDMSIETPACVSSVSAHPEYPAIIAVGLFNGEIYVYDIRQATDPVVASVTDKKELHKDEITFLKWTKDARTSKKIYLSGSRDGKILIWNALPTKNQLKLVDGFLMLIDYLPRNHFRSMGTEMGVSSASINTEDRDTLIIGCDSGGLFKCSFLSKTVANSKWKDDFPIDLKSPVEISLNPQYGPIYSISYSPFHRNLILTCGTDSEIKLYSVLQTASIMNFCPDNGYLYSIEWSPTRPCVFACGTQKGNILIYDLLESGPNSCQITQASDNQSPIYSVCFNQQRPGYLASGDRSGIVKIWKLSHNLTKSDPSELKKLNDISEKPFEKS